jgi:hypothetical protein
VSVEHINADIPALASIGGVDDQRLAQVSSHVNGRCHVLCTLVNLPPHAGVGHFAFSIALWLRNAYRKKNDARVYVLLLVRVFVRVVGRMSQQLQT